jgi:hypothetical protein
MWYRAEFEEDIFEMILADSDEEAIENASNMQEENGLLFNVVLLDDDYNEVKTVF